jgi:deoxyhypusine synthase
MIYFHTCASCGSFRILPRLQSSGSLIVRFPVLVRTDKTETPLSIDIVSDIRRLNDLSIKSKKAGMIILGGGVCKHQIANSMLFVRLSRTPLDDLLTGRYPCTQRNGADFSVYINTGQEFDGSDSGARPDEAVSWGKIRIDGESVKVYADATLVFPMLVAGTWGKVHWAEEKKGGKK